MATIFCAKFPDQPSLSRLAFCNGLKYRNRFERIGSADYLSTSFTNLVNFGPLTSEITTVKITTFWTMRKQ